MKVKIRIGCNYAFSAVVNNTAGLNYRSLNWIIITNLHDQYRVNERGYQSSIECFISKRGASSYLEWFAYFD